MKQDYLVLALKNLRHKGLRSWLTILGIFIGIAAVVALISLGQSLSNAVTGQFGSLSVDILTIQNSGNGFGPPGSTVVRKLTQHDVDLISSVSGIDEVIPRLVRIVSVEYNKEFQYHYIVSMPEDKKQLDIIYSTFDLSAISGRKLNENDKGKVLLGNDFSSTFSKSIVAGSSVIIQDQNFQVVGVLDKGSTFIINSAIMMLEKDMKHLLNIGDEYDMIVVQVSDKNKINEVAQSIEKKLRKDRNEKEGGEDFSVQTPIQSLASVNLILNIINLIIVGIAAISLLVGGIGIANTMYTSVLERTKEIGVMKAIGAKNSDVLWIFLIESGLLGLVGGIIGALLGLGMAFLVAFIAGSFISGLDFVVEINWVLFFGSILFALVIGILSGVLPAIQASKLNPVEALRR
jgi:putative ABC transport system permease protein